MGFATTFTAGQRLTAALVNALTDGGVTFTASGFTPASNALAAIIATGDWGGGLLMKDGSGYGGSWLQDSGATLKIGLGTSGGLTAQMTITADGVQVGSPTGGAKGAGTINATAVYDDNTLLTCYVPELVKAGGDVSKIDLEKWDALVPNREIPERVDEDGVVIQEASTEVRTHEPLRDFLANRADTIDARVYAEKWKETGVLPGMPTPTEWQANGPLSSGQMIQRLWETVELQAAHIAQLAAEIDQLKGV